MRKASPLLLLPLIAGSLSAQTVFHGNGVPAAYIANTPGVLGQQLTVQFGSPTTPLPVAILGISDGIGPVFIPHPLLGNIGLDLLSPAYQVLSMGLDPQGDGSGTLLLPPGFPQPTDPPLFMHAATFEAAGLSISKSVRVDWANPDGWEAVGALSTPRQLHSATALGSGPRDNETRVLIAGGATGSFVVPVPMDSAELYNPLTRTTTPLPPLQLPRASHRAVRLDSGLVLITGGVTTGGAVTADCELFDPGTGQFLPTSPMLAPRSGHALTLLPDGRVLATGGVADWQNTTTNFIGALNTAQNTAEVFDPISLIWSPLPAMSSPRLGHSQTVLADGRVLIASGISGGYSGQFGGGQVPFYTTTCQLFDPATNTFAPAATLSHTAVIGTPPFSQTVVYNGRAFHGASLLANGRVLLTGGFVATQAGSANNDETIVVGWVDVYDPVADTWTGGPNLPVGMAFHGHVEHQGGALVSGGFSGSLATLGTTANTYLVTEVQVSPLAPIGTDHGTGAAASRGGQTLTRLYDGTLLVYGGGVWPTTLANGFVYTP